MKNGRSKIRRMRLDERVGYRFSIISKRLNLAVAEMHSKKRGISINNWKIMSVIEFFGPLSATALGAHTSLDSDKVTRAVDALVRRGYVIRKTDERDRRRVVLTLSANGRRIHDRIELVASDVEAKLLGILAPREHKALHAALTKLQHHSSILFGRHSGSDENPNTRAAPVGPNRRVKTQARSRQSANGRRSRVDRHTDMKRTELIQTGGRR